MRTLAHISDLHFGRDDPAVVEGLCRDLLSHCPDLLVASGDFTQRGRRRQYARAAAFLSRLPFAKIVVPGNHDIPLFDLPRRFFYPLTRYQQYVSADLRPFYRDDQIAVLGINTARPFTFTWNGFWKDGRISPRQLEDIQRIVCSLPARLFKVVVTHHPFIPPPRLRLHGVVLGARRALGMLQKCGVDMLLAGHLHMGYSGDVRTHFEAIDRSIISVQAGTAVSTRRRREPNAYNLIAIDTDQVRITVRTWAGGRFDTGELTTYRRICGQWQRQS